MHDRHVINLTESGAFSTAGRATSSPEQVRELFRSLDPGQPVLLHIHGGLVDEASALDDRVRPMAERYRAAGIQPVFLVWETGWAEVARQVLSDLFTRPFTRLLTSRVERERHEGPATFAAAPPELDDLEVLASSLATSARDERELLDALEDDEEARQALLELGRSAEAAPTGEHAGPEAFIAGAGALVLLGAATLAAGTVALRVARRRRDPYQWHGARDTILEEVVRLIYLGSLGRIGWDRIKRNAVEAWHPSRDAWLVRDELVRLRGQGAPVSVIAHSAGSLHAGALLRALAPGVSGPVFDNLALVAAACDHGFFSQVLRPHLDRVERFALFGLRSEVEDASWMLDGVYQGSLLNVISGLLEERPGWPVLGLERFWDRMGDVQDAMARPSSLRVLAPTEEGAPWPSRARAHGGFDLEPTTHQTLARLVTSPDDEPPPTS